MIASQLKKIFLQISFFYKNVASKLHDKNFSYGTDLYRLNVSDIFKIIIVAFDFSRFFLSIKIRFYSGMFCCKNKAVCLNLNSLTDHKI